MPLSGTVCYRQAETWNDIPITKFEVSVFTRYENMTGAAKYRKWGGYGVVRGHPRSLEIAPFDRARMISYWPSVESLSLSGSISEI